MMPEIFFTLSNIIMNLFRLIALVSVVIFEAKAQDPDDTGWKSMQGASLEEMVAAKSQMPIATASGSSEAMAMRTTAAVSQITASTSVETTAIQSLVTPTVTTGGNVADEITPEILSLARGLRFDPVLIYAFVRNNVDFVPYYGCKKGAHLTLLEMSGNDMDQSALLVALLRASGYSPTYRSGPVAFFANQHIAWHGISPTPFAAMSDSDFAAAIGMSPSDPQLSNERMYYGLTYYMALFGYPIVERVNVNNVRAFGIPHVWVQLTTGGKTYQLSPSYKQYDWLPGIDLVAATGFSKTQLLADANPGSLSDTNGTTWVADLKYQNLSNRLSNYTNNFLSYIRSNEDTRNVEQLFPRKKLIQKAIATLDDADPLIPYNSAWAVNDTWTNTVLPLNRMSTLSVTAGTYNAATGNFTTILFNPSPIQLPALKGRKLSLAFNGNTATFRLDEATFGSPFTISGTSTSIRLAVTHDNYTWAYSSSAGYYKTDTTRSNQSSVQLYKKGNSNYYAFPYSYDDPQKLLRARQEVLSRYRQSGKTDADLEVKTEVLNIIGLEWYSQTWRVHRVVAALDGGVGFFGHRFGRVAQESSYYLDIFLQGAASQHRGQIDIYSKDIDQISSLFMSAMEHGVIEQLQGASASAVSTVNVVYAANQEKQKIYRATPSNWSSISSQFSSYSDYSSINSAIVNGAVGLLPQKGNNIIGIWNGAGYALEHAARTEMKISALNGGYSITTGEAGYVYILHWAESDPAYGSSSGNVINPPYTPETTPRQASADPVDLFSGAFFLDNTDLSLSGQGVLGLDFTRHYNTQRRHEDLSGLGYGWTHSNDIRLYERSSTGAFLGDNNTYQAAPFAVAALAAGGLHINHTTAKEWATSALIVRWGIEQMRSNAVAITMGNRTLEFIKMPDGSYTPPPGVSATLTKNNAGNFVLSRRHGDILTFNAAGQIALIQNSNGATKTFGYNGSQQLTTVTDSFNRTLTYTWNSGRIQSVTDGSRTVSFIYELGRLVKFTDAEGDVWIYHYDDDNRIDWTKDPQNRIIVENFYDSESRVKAQRSMGDPNRETSFTWSGFINVEEDPDGNLTSYAFDRRGRCLVVADALNHFTKAAYDGQDRIYYRSTAKMEIIQTPYNPDNNIIKKTDPEGNVSNYYYDTQLRLQRIRDKRGYDTVFSYTSSHQVNTITDPLGHITTYTYTSKGLPETITDAEGKTTTYGYDSWGGINKITYHDGNFSSATNNIYGDILTATDPDFRTNVNTWNNRRQIHTTSLPALSGEPNAVTTVNYDASGNLYTMEDANGNLTSYTYNSIGQKTTTTLPAVAGESNILTNEYDNRNLLSSISNSLNQKIIYQYDEVQRLKGTIDALGRNTQRFYDANNRLVKVIDPLLRETTQTWTARGQQWSDLNGLSKSAINHYDPNGNRDRFTDRRGKVYQFSYDHSNRLATITTPESRVTSTTYWDNNLVKTITEPSSQVTSYIYNNRNLLSTQTDATGSIGFTYYNSGLLNEITQGSDVISRSYDGRGRLKKYQLAEAGILKYAFEYRYDGNGNLKTLIYPDGKQVHYTYNSRNQLETVTDWRVYPNNTTTYQYNRLGRLTGVTRPNGTSNRIEHDDAGQITSIKEFSNGKSISYLRFYYDEAGQIERRFRAPLIQASWDHPNISATYDDDNRLDTLNGQNVQNDLDGNLISGPVNQNQNHISFNYNSRNQLVAANTTSYSYTPEGIRRSLTDTKGTTRFMVDPNAALNRLLVKENPDGSVTRYVYGLGLLYEVDEADCTKTYHFDQIGNTILRTDDNGAVIGRADYSAYGMMTFKEGDMNTPFLYNGKLGVQNDDNGLLYMQARYYSPYLMRFLNPDPIGFSGGHNWFAFADGNPISLNDPFGLSATAPESLEAYILRTVGPEPDGFWESLGGMFNGDFQAREKAIHEWNTANNQQDKFASYQTGVTVGAEVGELVGGALVASKLNTQSSPEPNFTPTQPNETVGWNVGQPINNLTKSGNVPAWNTVRARYWKNESLLNPENYSEANLYRMGKGLAPQRINPTTQKLESMELHHTPAQRDGGLFDVEKVWPDDHAAADPFRHTGN
jgi:RHS repeat-associated protein